MHACLVTQLCLAVLRPHGCSPLGTSVHGILQARILEWVAIFFSRGSSWPRDRTWVSCIAGRRFTLWATREAHICTYNPSLRISFPFQFSHSVVSDSLRPPGLQHSRPACPPPTPGVYSNLRSSSRWCHPTISSSVIPFSSRLQSFSASGSFQINLFFASGGQSIEASTSASVLPMNI